MPGVRLNGVEKSFGIAKVIHGVSMEIEHGDFAVFVGPSGCGKSTLLRMIAGLEETTAGKVEIEGRDVTHEEPARRGVAMVFQSYALYPHLTVFENMAFSLRLARAPRSELMAKVGEAARILRLEEHLQKKPSQLSGGQRQRVAIGRAIVREPKVFLFDEPLSNLDAELRVQMRLEVARLHKQIGATMIYVTHDQVEAMTLADKIFVLQNGIVRQSGRPLDLYDDPNNRFVAGFIGSPSMNFASGKVLERSAEGVAVALDGSDSPPVPARLGTRLEPGARVVMGMRPEHVEVAADGIGDPGPGGDGRGYRWRLLPPRSTGIRPWNGNRAPGQPREFRRKEGSRNYSARSGAAVQRGGRAGPVMRRKQVKRIGRRSSVRKFVSAVAATAVLLASAGYAAAEAQKVVWWDFLSGGDGVRMKALISDFNKEHPDIQIDATTLDWGTPFYTKVHTSAAVGQGPDVMTYHLSRIPIALDEGVLSPITDEDLANAGLKKEDFFPRAIDAATSDGTLYAVPFDIHAVILYYNKDLLKGTPYLDANGVLTGINNLDDFNAALKVMKDKGVEVPLSFATGDDGATWRVFYTLLSQAGGQLIVGDEVLPGDNSEKAVQAIQVMTAWRTNGYTPEQAEYAASVALFSSGKSAFHWNGVWEVPTFTDLAKNNKLGFEWSAAVIPTLMGQPATWATHTPLPYPSRKAKKWTPPNVRRLWK